MGKRDAAAAEWEPYKAEIERQYRVKELSEVVAHMRNEYGFYRSVHQYGCQFSKWGFSKYLSLEDYEYIWYTMKKRMYEGKDTEFVIRRRKFGSKDLITRLRRRLPKGFETVPLPEFGPAPPEGIQVLTPSVRTNGSHIDLAALPFVQFEQSLRRLAVFNGPSCSYSFDFPSTPMGVIKPRVMMSNQRDPLQLREAVTLDQAGKGLPNFPGSILNGTPTDSLFHAFSYCAYLSSNNLLFDGDLDGVIQWMVINELHLPLHELLKPISPTTVIFVQQLLRSAARAGYTGLVRSLLGVCLFSRCSERTLRSRTLLATAILNNQIDLTGHALDTGARLEMLDFIVDHVVEKDYDEMLKLLVSRDLHLGDASDWEFYLSNAAELGRTKMVKIILELKLADVESVSDYALFVAIKEHENIMRLLVHSGISVRTEFQIGYDLFDCEDVELLFYPIQTPLQVASYYKHWELVKFLIEQGALVDPGSSSLTTDSKYRKWIAYVDDDITADLIPVVSALQAAVRHGNIDMALFLLRKGAQVDARPMDRYGHTALQVATAIGNKDLVNLLLEWNADVNAPPGPYKGSTALNFAARLKDLEIFKTLLARGAKLNAAVDEEGRTLLQTAVKVGNLELVQILLQLDYSDVNELPDPDGGRTALQEAAESHAPFSIDIMRTLLTAGANANAPPAEKRGITALQGAASIGDIDKAELLLVAGAQVEAYSEQYGFTALHKAVENRRPNMVSFLLKCGATPYYGASAVTGRTPFQEACFNGDAQIACLFLPETLHSPLPIFVNAPPSFDMGVTALQAAVDSENMELIEMLLNYGADPNAPGAVIKGKTALERAVRKVNPEALKLLLERGARLPTDGKYMPPDPHRPIFFPIAERKDKRRECILLVLGSGLDKRVIPPIEVRSAFRTAVETGDYEFLDVMLFGRILPIDTGLEGWPKRTGLQLAARHGELECVKVFIKHGANINVTVDGYGKGLPALWCAVWHGHVEIAKYLVEQGADVKLHSQVSETVECHAPEKRILEFFKYFAESRAADMVYIATAALRHAASYGYVGVVRYLLDCGADVNAVPNKRGFRTALQGAVESGYARIVQILLDAGADVTAHSSSMTAIERAAYRGRLDILCMILQVLPPGQKTTEQLEEAEKLAGQAGHEELSRIIREHRERVSV